MEESGLVLKHAAGINFDLTVEETLGLFDFINVYRETLLALKPSEPETDPRLERVTIPIKEEKE
jgi:hypothetical protein